jgi:hypothetical protein
MARSVQLLRVFLASPSDVAEERDAAADVVSELNRTVASVRGLHLELVRWETHAAPGLGDDAQAVINEQVGDDYDIFVGVLYKRFGSPTLRAESGTEEEFDRAYKRFRSNPSALRLLLYFKQKAFMPTSNELEQMSKVFEFRKRVADQGALYWEYEEVSDFSAYLRVHLAKHIQDWGAGWGSPGLAPKPFAPPSKSAPTDTPTKVLVRRHDDDMDLEEVGLIELSELTQQRLEPALSAMGRITKATEEFGEKIQSHTGEMNALMAQTEPPEPLFVKAVVDRAARTIGGFGQAIDAEIPKLSSGFREGLNTISRALALFADFGEQGLQMKVAALDSLKGVVKVMGDTATQIQGFRKNIESMPRITTALSRAKTQAVDAINRLIAEVDSMKAVAEGILRSATDA